MALLPSFYRLLAKSFRYAPIKYMKDALRPLKHALFGKKGVYQAFDIVNNLVKRKGRKVRCAFDIGAAVGDTAAAMARAFPRARLYCFEPFPASFRALEARTSRYRDRLSCFRFGFSRENGEATFYIASSPDSSSLIPDSFAADPGVVHIREVGVEKIAVRTLDAFVKENRITAIDFMKIDVEGAEREVVEGGRETLRNCVQNLLIEISPLRKGAHSPDYIDVLRDLHAAGFSLVKIVDGSDFLFSKLL